MKLLLVVSLCPQWGSGDSNSIIINRNDGQNYKNKTQVMKQTFSCMVKYTLPSFWNNTPVMHVSYSSSEWVLPLCQNVIYTVWILYRLFSCSQGRPVHHHISYREQNVFFLWTWTFPPATISLTTLLMRWKMTLWDDGKHRVKNGQSSARSLYFFC